MAENNTRKSRVLTAGKLTNDVRRLKDDVTFFMSLEKQYLSMYAHEAY